MFAEPERHDAPLAPVLTLGPCFEFYQRKILIPLEIASMLLPRAVERLGRRVAQNSTYSESRQAMTQVPDLLASTRCRLVRTFADSETSLNARLYTQTDGLQLSVSVMYNDTRASSDTRAPIIESTSGPNLQGLESPLEGQAWPLDLCQERALSSKEWEAFWYGVQVVGALEQPSPYLAVLANAGGRRNTRNKQRFGG